MMIIHPAKGSLAVFVLILLWTFPAAVVGGNAPKQKALLLKQITSLHGPVSTYVTDRAVKLCFSDIDGYLLSMAPDWQVFLVNSKDKLVFHSTYENWMAHQIRRSYVGNFGLPEEFAALIVKVRSLQFLGRECILFRNVWARDAGMEYIVLISNTVPEQGCLVLEKWLSAPRVNAIPVALKFKNSYSESQKLAPLSNSVYGSYVDPLTCAEIRQTECEAKFFSPPLDCRKVDSEIEVFSQSISRQSVDVLKDLIDPSDSNVQHGCKHEATNSKR